MSTGETMKSTFKKLVILSLVATASTMITAKPMPNSIIVDDKAVVPVLKTQIIRKVTGQEPVRTVEATIFEVTNKGQDIVAREVLLQDHEGTFSEKQMSNPTIKKGSVIVPLSKIDITTTIKQDGEKIAETRVIDASGVEIKKDEAPIRRNLQLEQQHISEINEKMTHAVEKENGITTRDVIYFDEVE